MNLRSVAFHSAYNFYSKLIFKFLSLSLFPAVSYLEASKFLPLYTHNIDPSYEYLVNGINLLNLQPPGHLDHPGFALQLLIACVLGALFIFRFLFFGTQGLEFDFVSFPNIYTNGVLFTLMFLNSASVIFLTLTLNKITKSSVSFILPFLLIINTSFFQFLFSVRPESFLFSISNFLLSLSFMYFIKDRKMHKFLVISFLSFLICLGIFTKITFAPFLLIFFILKTFKDRLFFCFSLSLFSFIFFVPIRNVLPFLWFKNIIFNNGRHGQIVQSQTLESFLTNYFNLHLKLSPIIFLSIFSFIILFLLSYFIRESCVYQNRNIIILFVIILVYHILLFRESRIEDLIQLVSLSSTLLVLVVVFSTRILLKKNAKLISQSAINIFLIFFIFFLLKDYKLFEKVDFESRDLSNSTLLLESDIVISSYSVPTLFSALNFGNHYYGVGILDESLAQVYPNNLEFDIWRKKLFYSSGDEVVCLDLQKHFFDGQSITLVSRAEFDFEEVMNNQGFIFSLSRPIDIIKPWTISNVEYLRCDQLIEN